MDRAGRTGKILLALGMVLAGWIGARPVEGETVEVSPRKDWEVLPSLMGANGEIIVATGALFLPWRGVRGEYDYADAARLEGGVGLGG